MAGFLHHSPQRIMGAVLANLGIGVDPEDTPTAHWPIYDGREPDRPDDLIKVSGTGSGRDFGFTQVDKQRQEWYGLQFYIRSKVDNDAWRKADEIAVFLDCLTNYTITLPFPDTVQDTGTAPVGGNVYLIASVFRTTAPVFVGRDTEQGKRIVYVVNAVVSIRECVS